MPSPVERASVQVINEVREGQEMPIAELARRADMSRSQLSQVLSGQKPILWTHFVSLCTALGLDVATVIRMGEARSVQQGEGARENAEG